MANSSSSETGSPAGTRRPGPAQAGAVQVIHLPIFELLGLSVIPVAYRAVISGDAAVYLRVLAAAGAGVLLSGQVAVIPADGIGGRHGEVKLSYRRFTKQPTLMQSNLCSKRL